MEKLRVLIIDDDRDTAEFFRTVLNLVGFECEIVLTAKEALAQLAVSVPNLVLLDMRLGLEIGGEDILYQIRSNPRFDNTRVIVITAYPNLAAPITNLAELVLLKPVEVDQLKTLAERIGSLELKPHKFAFRDPVTDLFNRDFFLTRLELAFQRTRRRPDFLYAVMLMDIEFAELEDKSINPNLTVGILRQFADRMRSHLRPTDTLARISGRRFAVLLEDLSHLDNLQVIINRIDKPLSKPYKVESEEYKIDIRFTMAVHDVKYQEPGDILAAAEAAFREKLEV